MLRRFTLPLSRVRLPRFVGLLTTALLLAAAASYGVVRGGHLATVVSAVKDAGDAGANAMGMRIAAVSLSGQKQVTREEIFAAAGVTDHSSLIFLDVEAARARLKAIPWIAEATVRKLYPDRLQITITEREAFALWQSEGKIFVVAADGTVLLPNFDRRFANLPFVVGRGAETRAKDFLAVLDRYPAIREQVRASILVAGRRWNLRLKNGLDVRLPETEVAKAIETLIALNAEKNLLSRDIAAVDLRLADRVTVRLSEAAAKLREDALKDKKKRKGNDA